MVQAEALIRSEIPGLEVRRGKVRDIYDLGDRLLLVATDRISAYDTVMANGIPDKGALLTRMSLFWFEMLADKFEHAPVVRVFDILEIRFIDKDHPVLRYFEHEVLDALETRVRHRVWKLVPVDGLSDERDEFLDAFTRLRAG